MLDANQTPEARPTVRSRPTRLSTPRLQVLATPPPVPDSDIESKWFEEGPEACVQEVGAPRSPRPRLRVLIGCLGATAVLSAAALLLAQRPVEIDDGLSMPARVPREVASTPAPVVEAPQDFIRFEEQRLVLGATWAEVRETLRECRQGPDGAACKLAWFADERGPRTEVVVPAFDMDRRPVSNAEYGRCVEAGVCGSPQLDRCRVPSGSGWRWGRVSSERGHADLPVVCVTRSQAADYCLFEGKRVPALEELMAAAGPAKFPWGEAFREDALAAQMTPEALADAALAGRTVEGVELLTGAVAQWTTTVTKNGLVSRYGTSGETRRPTQHRTANRARANPRKAYSIVGIRCVKDGPRDTM